MSALKNMQWVKGKLQSDDQWLKAARAVGEVKCPRKGGAIHIQIFHFQRSNSRLFHNYVISCNLREVNLPLSSKPQFPWHRNDAEQNKLKWGIWQAWGFKQTCDGRSCTKKVGAVKVLYQLSFPELSTLWFYGLHKFLQLRNSATWRKI